MGGLGEECQQLLGEKSGNNFCGPEQKESILRGGGGEGLDPRLVEVAGDGD